MSNVIDFVSRKALKDKENSSFLKQKSSIFPPLSCFEKTVVHNKNNQERLRKEREQANKNVIKNYKIK